MSNMVHEPNKSNVLLIELVIVILFFALTAATAMQLFVASHQKSQRNNMVQRASIVAQDWAEQLRGERDMAGFLDAQGFSRTKDGLYELKQGDVVLQALLWQQDTPTGVLMEAELNCYNAREVSADGPVSDEIQPLSQLQVCFFQAHGEEVGG